MNAIPYYRLEPSKRTAEVGHWPQIIDLEGKTRADVEAYGHLLGIDPLPSRLPRADGFILHAHAKLTDLISNRFVPKDIGLTVSDRLRSLLEQHGLAGVRACPMTFSGRRQPGRYFILYADRSPELIDFGRSTYIETDILLHPVGPEHVFVSAQELVEAALTIVTSTEHDIAPHRIALNRLPDLLRLPHDPHGLHISARLKSAIEVAGMSGVSISESVVQFFAADSQETNE